MCGILAVITACELSDAVIAFAQQQSKIQMHRGPDERGSYQANQNILLCHERLSIVDVQGGKQPLHHCYDNHQISSIVNGEIYNHKAIRENEIHSQVNELLYTHSDSEAVAALYLQHLKDNPNDSFEESGKQLVSKLDGMFAFLLVDALSSTESANILIGRDPLGIKPLYVGYVCSKHPNSSNPNCFEFEQNNIEQIWFASEMKSLTQCCYIEECPSGHFSVVKMCTGSKLEKLNYKEFYHPRWYDHPSPIQITDESVAVEMVQAQITTAVEKRMMADVEVGVFLSGGLDSSITAALCKQYIDQRQHQTQLHSFCVGLENSPDILHAQEMAEHLGTVHHERIFTIEEGIDALENVIYHLETYDVPLLRSAVPQYFISELAARYVKVVLTGEGADELFAGYVHFGTANSSDSLRRECKRLTKELGQLNLRRCDRMTMGFSLESRVPFLDVEVMESVFSMDPELFLHKNSDSSFRIEKDLLRKAFGHLLTDKVTKRTKLMFSEGVGDHWVRSLDEYCAAQISDDNFASSVSQYSDNPPATKTDLFVRRIYEKHFGPSCSRVVCLWTPGESF